MRADARRREIDEHEYREACAFDWKNPHSRRLQALTGDDKLVVAFDGSYVHRGERVGVWRIGRLIQRTVIKHFGSKELATREVVPVSWTVWTDPDGRPRAIDDPRLADFVRSCDRYRPCAESLRTINAAVDAANDRKRAARRVEARDRAKELWRPFVKMADERVGFVGCEGPGGQRKHFYDGCLQG